MVKLQHVKFQLQLVKETHATVESTSCALPCGLNNNDSALKPKRRSQQRGGGGAGSGDRPVRLAKPRQAPSLGIHARPVRGKEEEEKEGRKEGGRRGRKEGRKEVKWKKWRCGMRQFNLISPRIYTYQSCVSLVDHTSNMNFTLNQKSKPNKTQRFDDVGVKSEAQREPRQPPDENVPSRRAAAPHEHTTTSASTSSGPRAPPSRPSARGQAPPQMADRRRPCRRHPARRTTRERRRRVVGVLCA